MKFEELLDRLHAMGGLAQLDVSVTEGALQSIRSELEASGNAFDRYRALSAQVGATENLEWRRLLMQLRDGFEAQMLDERVAGIDRMFAASTDEGWKAWLTALAEAVSRVRTRFATELCRRDFPFAESHKEAVKEIRRTVEAFRQSLWEEAYDGIAFLSRQDVVPAATRAALVAMRAQIEFYRFGNSSQAKLSFEEAAAIAPDDGRVVTCLADYWQGQGDAEKAAGLYQRAIELAPHDASGYIGLGKQCEKDGRFEQAEAWFRKAITLAGGDVNGYILLLGFIGRPATLLERQDELQALLERAKAVDPEAEYDLYLSAGACYVAAGLVDDAREWYRKAIGLEKDWPRAYTELADLCRAQGSLDEAERLYRKATEVAPDYSSGYLALADFYEKQARWADALKVYEGLPERPRQWASYARASIGRMQANLGNYSSAIEEYRKAIAAAPDYTACHRYLSTAYSALGEYDRAEEELDLAYQADNDENVFKEAKAALANTRANRFYEDGAYAEAVPHYTRAIELDPTEAVYLTNLANALARLKDPGKRAANLEQAAACYERAQQVSKTKDYTEQVNRLRRRAAFARTHGERWLDFMNVVTPLAVEVASDLVGQVEGPAQGTLSEEFSASVKRMRKRVSEELGVQVPGLRVRGNETDLADGTYIILINDIPLASGNLSLKRRFCPGSAEVLSHLGIAGEPVPDPVTGDGGFWIEEKDWALLDSQKVEAWSFADYMMRHVEAIVRKNAGEFLGHQDIVDLLESGASSPLEEIRASSAAITALTTVCKALLAEEVPLRPFEELCAVFKSCHQSGVGLRETVERIRGVASMRAQLPGNDAGRSLLTLNPRFEVEIRRSLYEDAGHLMLALEPERCQEALTAVRNGLDGRLHALVVEDGTLRPFIRKLVELEFPDLPVLSRAELRNDAGLVPGNTIDFEGEPAVDRIEFSSGASWSVEGAASDSAADLRDASPASTDCRIEVFVSEDFDAQPAGADDSSISELLSLLQEGLFYELGITLPDVQLATDRSLPARSFRFRLNGVEHAPVSGLEADESLVNDTADRLALLRIQARDAVNPANGSQCAVVRGQEQVEICNKAGLTTWNRREFLVLHLSAEVRRAAATFQTEEIAQYNLDSLAEAFPDLVRFALERYSLPKIALLCRELLTEGISIRDLRSILESLLAVNGTTDVDLNRFIVFFANPDALCPAGAREVGELAPSQLADFVRSSLKRYISYKYTRGGNTLVVYLMDPAIERRVIAIPERPLTVAEHENLRAAIGAEVGNLPAKTIAPVLLTNFDVRRALRKIIERDFPWLAVVSYQELSADLNIQPIARISW